MNQPSVNATHANFQAKIHALDWLRAAAIVWVILRHLNTNQWIPESSNSILVRFMAAGDAGVDLFFVLSGYLIASIVLKEIANTGRLSVRRFWYRRWMRTLPAYYVTLAVIALSDFVYTSSHPWHRPWSYLVFLQTTVTDIDANRFLWSWSLCVEEWFYLFMPLLVLGLTRLGIRRADVVFRLIAISALVTSIVGRALVVNGSCIDGHTPGFAIPYCRLDGIAIGIIAATMPRLRSAVLSSALGAFGLAALAVYVWSDRPYWLETQRLAPLSLIFGTIVYSSVSNSPWRNVRFPGAETIAGLSYSLYLVHPILMVVILRSTPGMNWTVRISVYIAATMGAAVLLRHFVEIPFLRIRDGKPRPEDRESKSQCQTENAMPESTQSV